MMHIEGYRQSQGGCVQYQHILHDIPTVIMLGGPLNYAHTEENIDLSHAVRKTPFSEQSTRKSTTQIFSNLVIECFRSMKKK